MKTFHLVRLKDESGISGSGVVAEVAEFSNGKAVVSWLTNIHSTTVYDSIGDVEKIHGHNGCSQLVENRLKTV